MMVLRTAGRDRRKIALASYSLSLSRLLVQLEDPDLDELGYGEVLESAILHVADKLRGNVKNPDLDQLVESRLIPQTANLPDFISVDALHLERDQLVGIGHFVAHRCQAVDVIGIHPEDAQCNEIINGHSLYADLLHRLDPLAGYIHEGIGHQFFGIVSRKSHVPHAVDEG